MKHKITTSSSNFLLISDSTPVSISSSCVSVMFSIFFFSPLISNVTNLLPFILMMSYSNLTRAVNSLARFKSISLIFYSSKLRRRSSSLRSYSCSNFSRSLISLAFFSSCEGSESLFSFRMSCYLLTIWRLLEAKYLEADVDSSYCRLDLLCTWDAIYWSCCRRLGSTY